MSIGRSVSRSVISVCPLKIKYLGKNRGRSRGGEVGEGVGIGVEVGAGVGLGVGVVVVVVVAVVFVVVVAVVVVVVGEWWGGGGGLDSDEGKTRRKRAKEQVQAKNRDKNNTFQSDTPAGRRIFIRIFHPIRFRSTVAVEQPLQTALMQAEVMNAVPLDAGDPPAAEASKALPCHAWPGPVIRPDYKESEIIRILDRYSIL